MEKLRPDSRKRGEVKKSLISAEFALPRAGEELAWEARMKWEAGEWESRVELEPARRSKIRDTTEIFISRCRAALLQNCCGPGAR